MKRARRVIIAAAILAVLLGVFAREGEKAVAQTPTPAQAAERQTTIVVSYTQYEWWLIRWSDNDIVCRLFTDHEGLPTGDDVRTQCGEDLYQEWIHTPPCTTVSNGTFNTTECSGLYLHQVSSQEKEKEVVITLPPAVAYVTLQGCDLVPPENICPQLPSLLITGKEPLPNERIIAIEGLYGETPFHCEGSTCALPLHPTPLEGIEVQFWAVSSYGDTSDHYSALVRVLDTGVSETPGGGGFYVDVVSSQWRGAELASCVRIWKAFPPIGRPPDWLATPKSSELLASAEPYFYLAGRLIAQGVVDASQCPSGGLLPNGYANACGLEQSQPVLETWQNQFDAQIIEVSDQVGIPAQLLKNLFAQESQFWPGVFRVPYEFGLGQITDNGADTILLWNRSFYNQFCPLVLSQDACQRGYLKLSSDEKAILRGAVALEAEADCSSCPAGIDLSNVNFSLSLFAETLQANCEQVGQIVSTATDSSPGSVASYEDLWRFTIANYHAGPGCLSYAIHSAWNGSGRLDWQVVASQFTEPCQGVVPYVNKITHVEGSSQQNPATGNP